MSEIDAGALYPDLLPMEARSVEDLAAGPGWQFEPKWTAFAALRCAAASSDAQDQAAAHGGLRGRQLPLRAEHPYERNTRLLGSLLLGLCNPESKLNHIGFCATLREHNRPALTRQLEGLVRPPGFIGDAPGGPSRWSAERSTEWQPLRPELVVEVRYDHVSGNRFRHGTRLPRWRSDKAPRQCTFDQLDQAMYAFQRTAAAEAGGSPRSRHR